MSQTRAWTIAAVGLFVGCIGALISGETVGAALLVSATVLAVLAARRAPT